MDEEKKNRLFVGTRVEVCMKSRLAMYVLVNMSEKNTHILEG